LRAGRFHRFFLDFIQFDSCEVTLLVTKAIPVIAGQTVSLWRVKRGELPLGFAPQ
jgi:hypothetical protein